MRNANDSSVDHPHVLADYALIRRQSDAPPK